MAAPDGSARATPPGRADRDVDVLVVGAGQAGLGVAYHLSRDPGLRVLVLDAAPVGHRWLDRWDSLTLFTPRCFSALPGLRFPPGAGRCPSRTEMADYLRDYAERFALPVETGVRVHRLTRDGSGFVAATSAGRVRAWHVVVATGPFHKPYRPPASGDLDPIVWQRHSSDYRRPADVPDGDVLVVGGGNSAAQRRARRRRPSRHPRLPGPALVPARHDPFGERVLVDLPHRCPQRRPRRGGVAPHPQPG